MKKVVFTALMLIGLAFNSQAQDISKNALGLRLGSNDGFGGEISYQRKIDSDRRLEFDLGWRSNDFSDAIKLTGLHQWVWNIDKGFNWYAGIGGGIASYGGKDFKIGNTTYKGENDFAVFAAGDIGIEYNFDIPIQLSLDFRPEFYFSDGINENYGSDIALGIRYRF